MSNVFDNSAEPKAAYDLQNILEHIANAMFDIGEEDVFSILTKTLGDILGVDYSFISVVDNKNCKNLKTLAVSSQGKMVDNIVYKKAKTPCEKVFGQEYRYYQSGTQKKFEDDNMIKELGIEGYAGIPLFSRNGEPIGLLAVMHSSPLFENTLIESTLKIFSAHAATEVERVEIDLQKQKAQDDFIEIERQYQTVFNESSNGIILWSSDKRIINFNPAVFKMHACSHEDYNLYGFEIFVAPESRSLLPNFYECIKEGKSFQQEMVFLHLDGSAFPVEVTLTPITLREEVCSLCMISDLTKMKKSENEKIKLQNQLQQAQKMEAIGHVSGGIAHDFNNILTSIIGNLDLARYQSEILSDAKIIKYLDRARKSSNRGKSLIQQLMLFSKGENTEKHDLMIEVLYQNSIELIKAALPSTINIEQNYENNLPKIHGNEMQLEQILLNLCMNASDGMRGNGKIKIDVTSKKIHNQICSSCKSTVNDAYVCISVKDTGEGITKEVLDRIFEPFFTTKKEGAGTGMGLSTVHGIVHQHHGHIIVDSVPDEFTDFCVLLPRKNKSLYEGAVENNNDIVATKIQRKINGRVLVVDDESDVCEFMRDLMESWGLDVKTFTDPNEALVYIENNNSNIDVVIADYMMPRCKGTDLTTKVSKINPNIKCILHTAYADTKLESNMEFFGICSIINKPADSHDLYESISEVMC